MKTKFTLISALFVCAFFVNQLSAETNNYYGTSGALNTAVWSLAEGGPYTSVLNSTNGAVMNFNNATTNVTGASVTVTGINVNADVTIGTIGGTISNLSGGVIPINVGTGFTFDAGSQVFAGQSTAGFVKNGNGVLAFIGGGNQGGFTLNAGTVIMRAANTMGGVGGSLTINGGIIAATANRSLTARYTGITIGGDFTLGATTGLALSSALLIFDAPTYLGSATRAITIGGTGTYTLGGAISETGTAGLTVNSTAAGILVLSGANTYSGITTINSGASVRLGNASALGTTDAGTIVNSGANLDLYGTNYTNLESLSISGTGVVSEGAISNNGIAATATFAGPITMTGTTTIAGGSGMIILNNTSAITGTGNLTLTGGAGGTISSPIAITGNITKAGLGNWTLAGANTYSGTTNIGTGTVTLGASEVLPNSSAVAINGATLSTGATVGYTETAGTLDVNETSTIALGTGSHTLTFADSHSISWVSGKTLTITGWTGTNAGGTAGRIFFGSDASGLTSGQLGQFVFSGYAQPAMLLSTGELVPDVATAVDNASLNNITVSATDGKIILNGMAEKSVVTVYNTNGQLIKTVLSEGTKTEITIGTKGVYIVKVADKNFKIVL